MLILTRKVGESVVITLPDGRPAVVRLLRAARREVRLGIEAPREVPVHRVNPPREEAPCPPPRP